MRIMTAFLPFQFQAVDTVDAFRIIREIRSDLWFPSRAVYRLAGNLHVRPNP